VPLIDRTTVWITATGLLVLCLSSRVLGTGLTTISSRGCHSGFFALGMWGSRLTPSSAGRGTEVMRGVGW